MSSSTTDSTTHRTGQQEVPLGMVVIGLMVSSILYGITLTQTEKYFKRFKRDPVLVKALVAAVFLMDTVSIVFIGHSSWFYLVTDGDPKHSIWSLNVELAISIAISGISETFLAIRVFKLSGQKYFLTVMLLLPAMLHFASGEVAAVEFLLLKRFARFGMVKVPSIIRLSSAAVCDTSIAVALCYFLQQKRTGFKRTDDIINYLMIFSINSGLLTSIVSVACLITYLVVPKTWVYLLLCFLLGRLYANTFLCCLNSRHIIYSNPIVDVENIRDPTQGRPRMRGIKSSVLRRHSDENRTPTQIDVYVVTETVTDGLPHVLSGGRPLHIIASNANMEKKSTPSSSDSTEEESSADDDSTQQTYP